jgi:hypothetical protein
MPCNCDKRAAKSRYSRCGEAWDLFLAFVTLLDIALWVKYGPACAMGSLRLVLYIKETWQYYRLNAVI